MKNPIPYAKALAIAEEVRTLLLPDCQRIEIAGSLRRQKAMCGDVEFAIIPKYATDLFGISTDEMLLKETMAKSNMVFVKGKDKYRQYLYTMADGNEVAIELWITTPEQWGMIFTIRTGSSDYTHHLVTSKFAGGALPSGMKVEGGRLWRNGEVLHTPEEADVFTEIGIPWIKPEFRTDPII